MLSRQKVAMGVAEVLGTGILTFTVLAVSRSPIGIPYFVAIAIGLIMTLLVLMLGTTSGAHCNPALTLGLWSARKVGTIQAVLYIALQFVGAALAWRLFTYLTSQSLQSIAGNDFHWRIFVAEMIGAAVFTFGVAAAIYQKYTDGRLAATIGGALLLGVLVASVASNGLINPAIAFGVNSWSLTYALAPIAGALVGVNLYGMLFAGERLLPTLPKQRIKKASVTASITRTTRKARVKKSARKTTSRRRK